MGLNKLGKGMHLKMSKSFRHMLQDEACKRGMSLAQVLRESFYYFIEHSKKQEAADEKN